MTATDRTIKVVSEAAKWLDRVEPGWEHRIDPDTLNIACCDNCVLGQLYDRYGNASAFVPAIVVEDADEGPVKINDAFAGSYTVTNLWKQEIKDRLESSKKEGDSEERGSTRTTRESEQATETCQLVEA